MNDQTSITQKYAYAATDVTITHHKERDLYYAGVEVQDAEGCIGHGNASAPLAEDAFHAAMQAAGKRLEINKAETRVQTIIAQMRETAAATLTDVQRENLGHAHGFARAFAIANIETGVPAEHFEEVTKRVVWATMHRHGYEGLWEQEIYRLIGKEMAYLKNGF